MTHSKRPTQADVARLAGVSRATVSYVVNQRAASGQVQISPETRQRVWDAVAELDYQPDARALSLRSGATRTLGLLIPDVHNPHFWQIAAGVEEEAHGAGYDLLLSSSRLDRAQEQGSLQALMRRRMDGLVLVVSYATPDAILTHIVKRKLPVVFLSCVRYDFDYAAADYRQGARLAMEHLLTLGHREIGLIHGVGSTELGSERFQEYRDALAGAGIPYRDEFVVRCGAALEDGYAAACALLSRMPRPTALVAINDLLALGALRAAADLGLRVPADLSIMGYDDIPQAGHAIPRLTTVRSPARAMGRRSVELLLARLATPDRPPQKVKLPMELVVRESTGPAA